MPKVWTGPHFAMPERLYRYRPLASEEEWGYLEQILLDSTMYGAPPVDLQKMDPEDCRVALNTRCTFDEFKQSPICQNTMQQHPEWHESGLRQWHRELMKPDFHPGVFASLQLNVDQYGVICFSFDGDIPTQWQNYASERRGVCLVFDHLKDSDFFKKVKPVTKLKKYKNETEFRALFPDGSGQQIHFKPEALIRSSFRLRAVNIR